MRIISGKFKGHKLNIPKNFLIRPTTDRFKESLFSIINSEKYSSNIDGKYFLDLCSGSGGIGIEAFSRGAKKVYMIDKNQNAINLINKNLSKITSNIELGRNLFVLKQDITKIKKLQLPQFDFIYLDPPYSSNIYSIVLKNISDSKILNNKGLILIETDKLINADKFNLEEIFSNKIGSSYLQCFKKLLNPLK